MSLDDDQLQQALSPLLSVITATGFTHDEGHPQPTWVRLFDEGGGEKVVLWRHPRYPDELHGHVATSRSPHAVHLRFFDPEWSPERVLPGYIGKGFAFDGDVGLTTLAAQLSRVIWPRALAWFEAPVDAASLLEARGAVLTLVTPGPLLEQHRRRAEWLEAQGHDQEAEYVRGIVAEIEAMFAARDTA